MCIALSAVCCTSQALEHFVGKVTLLEPTYLPNLVHFTMDSGSASCPTGTWLKWTNADQNNNKAVYATLLAALTAGKTIRLYVNDGDTTCTGAFLHMLN